MLRRSIQQNVKTSQVKRRHRSRRECVAVLIEKEYDDKHHDEDQPLKCELQGEDRIGKQYMMVRIKGLTSSWARKNNVTSGVTTIYAPNGADIDDETHELDIPSEAQIKLGRHTKTTRGTDGVASYRSRANVFDRDNSQRHRNLAAIVRKVVVVRVEAKDASTTASEAQLANDIFGSNGVDSLNLKSGFKQCSNGLLQFEPLTTNTLIGMDGVLTVNLPNTIVSGASDDRVLNDVLSEATRSLGKHPSLLADHVMVCIPPGTAGNWISYASVNSWMSVFNDKWCQYPSAQMHEIGHNLNLAHSGKGINNDYGDQSGIMGLSYNRDEGPNMCFNGAKTWQLGWFSSYHVDLPLANNHIWKGDLVGFSENRAALASDKMIIRIRSSVDYYIHFNRKSGNNFETLEGGDQVMVSTRSPGIGYAKSNLVAKLNATGNYTFPIVNEDNTRLVLVVKAIDTRSVPARASISIQFGVPVPASMQPTRAPTAAPTKLIPSTGTGNTEINPTPAPVQPTLSPVKPTLAPVKPTSAPVQPTPVPVKPTPVPVKPTPAPLQPTPAPVQPTRSPVQPTPAPVQPTRSPVQPTRSPVQPTPAPVQPTPAPVQPTPAPVQPTLAPVQPTQSPFFWTRAPGGSVPSKVVYLFFPVKPTTPKPTPAPSLRA